VLVLNVVVSISTLAYTAGVVSSRLSALEKLVDDSRVSLVSLPVNTTRINTMEATLARQQARMDLLEGLNVKMASVETELRAMNATLSALQRFIERMLRRDDAIPPLPPARR
jgi:uncharacterized coiled-coil protein SlyX